jgi:hypothetical protein
MSPDSSLKPASPLLSPANTRTVRLSGLVRPELWNRLGSKILPKLRTGTDLRLGVDISVNWPAGEAATLEAELNQVLRELGLEATVRIE